MNEILELQTGQVSFISGLMAGFSLSVVVQVFRSRTTGSMATTCFVLFTVSSLLFLVGLYIEVASSIQLAGLEQFPPELLNQITTIRAIGTSAATTALFMFIISIGLIGWLHSKLAGIIKSARPGGLCCKKLDRFIGTMQRQVCAQICASLVGSYCYLLAQMSIGSA